MKNKSDIIQNLQKELNKLFLEKQFIDLKIQLLKQILIDSQQEKQKD